MPYPLPSDLRALVGEQMASGKYASEDELLRCALLALAEEVTKATKSQNQTKWGWTTPNDSGSPPIRPAVRALSSPL
jgi:Arc/MetJ-type ribon-helix-helix transcriptional regulator